MNDIEKVILTDCDGVLLNWEYAFHVWILQRGYELVPGTEFHYSVEVKYNLSEKESNSFIRDFNSSAAMGFLPPLRDAVHYVQKLHREHGYVFHCITSMSKDPHACELRKMNLNKVFGETVFDKFVFLDCGADKDDVLKAYENSEFWWVEDKLENAVAGLRAGLSPILMEHGHNMIRTHVKQDDPIWKEANYIPRYKNWKQIYSRITGE